MTERITFDSGSSVMVVETDNANPIQVVDLTTKQVVFSKFINDTIQIFSMFNSSNQFLYGGGISHKYFIDMEID